MTAITEIKTTCPYCGVGCGINASVDQQNRQVKISGDSQHPANYGRLCSKGTALGETLSLSSRLLQPRISGKEASWNEALDLVAQRWQAIIAAHGPGSVALYGSGQLLTEDYYVANKFMKGFIGSANIDTNSRLCMSSSVAGHKRAFGADTVPGCYEDLELADLIVLIGSNAAWCHPVIFQRLRALKEQKPNLKIVVIDPRQTASCDIADLHLALKPGSDAYLFNGLLAYLMQQGVSDQDFITQHTEHFASALSTAQADCNSLSAVATHCQLALADLQQFYQWYQDHPKVMSLYSQGINQSSSGTDKVNAIINCHLATGRIGHPGMGPFSLTGQPNAMGGREVGGLAHQLAAHMDFSNPDDIDRVGRFWGSTHIAKQPGYPAVDLFDAIFEGKVKAVWIMGTNPVVSLPNADKIKQALQRCEFVVVSDCISTTDTTILADVLLPAQGWSEKEGTVTNSERRISRQRRLLNPAGAAQPDWWIITQVAQRMGFAHAFQYRQAADIFREHAALSGFENDAAHGLRDFDLSGLSTLSDSEYQQLQPIQWPVNQQYPSGRARFFADGQFFTASGKAQFVAVKPRLAVNQPNNTYPLTLNTGRIRDQWHTMTRTALAAKLNQHFPEPFVEIHPRDAEDFQLAANGLARIESAWGSMLARVKITASQLPGNVFVPMHWTEQYAKQGRMGALVNPAVDPISKQPEAKQTPVCIKPFMPSAHGFIVSRYELNLDEMAYWVKIRGEHYYRYEFAGELNLADWQTWLSNLLSAATKEPLNPAWQEYQDPAQGIYRSACFNGKQLHSVCCLARNQQLPERNWLASLFAKSELTQAERLALLSGIPPKGENQSGKTVCACFNVGENTICTAIRKQQLTSAREVGQYLRAGTNCGSCIPDINALLQMETSKSN